MNFIRVSKNSNVGNNWLKELKKKKTNKLVHRRQNLESEEGQSFLSQNIFLWRRIIMSSRQSKFSKFRKALYLHLNVLNLLWKWGLYQEECYYQKF